MKVVYGVELVVDEKGNITLAKSKEASEAAKAFMEESKKIGYMNLLPRNAFMLDLGLFVKSFDVLFEVCNSRDKKVPVSCMDRANTFASSFSCLRPG